MRWGIFDKKQTNEKVDVKLPWNTIKEQALKSVLCLKQHKKYSDTNVWKIKYSGSWMWLKNFKSVIVIESKNKSSSQRTVWPGMAKYPSQATRG